MRLAPVYILFSSVAIHFTLASIILLGFECEAAPYLVNDE